MGRKKLIINNGDKYGRWVVVKELKELVHPSGKKERQFLCKCDCGNKAVVSLKSLRHGNTNSCGCLQKELAAKRVYTHGLSDSSEYQIWKGMKQRCFNKKYPYFKNYGGRGIKVCDEWMKFENFYADMGERPSKKHSIDRIDNNGNYEPANCRWATKEEQVNNTRRNIFIEYKGKKQTITQWEKELGFNKHTLAHRLRRGWKVKIALIK